MTDAPPSPPQTPPTEPGALRTIEAPPIRGRAVAALIGSFFPVVAFASLGVGLAEVRRPGATRLDRNLGIAAIVAGGIGSLMTLGVALWLWFMFQTMNMAIASKLDDEVRQVQNEAALYARRHGTYPAHVALMITDQANPVSVQRWVAPVPGSPERGAVVVGDFDLADYGRRTVAELDDAIAAEVEARGTAPYRFGWAWFTPLTNVIGDPDLVFAYGRNPQSGRLIVIGESGAIEYLREEGWTARWQRDAVARERDGLPALAAPPIPE